MKRLLAFLLMLLAASPALALTRSQIPTKMGVAWGQSAGTSYIRVVPVPSQIGIQNCAASFTDGFPPLTFVPPASGGCGPFGQDMNGILRAITLWNQWASAGGPMPYDSAFQTSIGGYPQDALVQSNVLHGRVWRSTVDNNTTNPDDQTGATVSWQAQPGTFPAGTPVPALGATAPPNTVPANGLTVGNGSSNATNLANVTAYWLFVYVWNNCATCNLFNSSGGGVARGANAAADWNANNAIAVPDLRGSALIGADATGVGGTSTRLTGVPVTTGSTTTAPSILGENLHTLLATEIPAHTHPITDPGHTHPLSPAAYVNSASSAGITTGGVAQGISPNLTTTGSAMTGITVNNNTGGGGAHNTVPRSATVFWNLAL